MKACVDTKICSKCKVSKLLGEFHRHSRTKDGLRTTCKACHCAEVKAYSVAHRQPTRHDKTHRIKAGQEEKLCIRCNQWKTYSEYQQTTGKKINKDGLRSACRECWRKRTHKSTLPSDKQCTACGKIKPIDQFSKSRRDGCSSQCKSCKNLYTKKFYCKNRDKVLQRSRISQRVNYKRKQANPRFRLSSCISKAIHRTIHGSKKKHWEDIVGFTFEEFRNHLESQFQPGMNWGNYGEWHIDHKIPVSVFNFDKPEHIDFQRCWALDNLSPLWAKDNMSKGAKIEKPFQPMLKLAITA